MQLGALGVRVGNYLFIALPAAVLAGVATGASLANAMWPRPTAPQAAAMTGMVFAAVAVFIFVALLIAAHLRLRPLRRYADRCDLPDYLRKLRQPGSSALTMNLELTRALEPAEAEAMCAAVRMYTPDVAAIMCEGNGVLLTSEAQELMSIPPHWMRARGTSNARLHTIALRIARKALPVVEQFAPIARLSITF